MTSSNRQRCESSSPYARNTPMLAMGFLALLLVLLLKIVGG